eukprot:2206325-Amphidinium_carterae.1
MDGLQILADLTRLQSICKLVRRRGLQSWGFDKKQNEKIKITDEQNQFATLNHHADAVIWLKIEKDAPSSGRAS